MTATALVLAAQRDGRIDPLAATHGVTHKCLVPIAGRPLIEHVLLALAAAPEIGEIRISIDNPQVIADLPLVARMLANRKLSILSARPNLVDSVVTGVVDAGWPVLATTADNALLTPQAIADIVAQAGDADVAVAFTRREAVLAAHPDGQRRFYRFAEASYSNCNAYWLGKPRALAAAEVFRAGGQFAKHPLRIVNAFGITNLIRFRFGIGTLAGAFQRFSKRFALDIRALTLSDGAVAIDVDNVRTHAIAEQLLEARKAPRLAEAA